MTDKRKAELFDNVITWVWEHVSNHGVKAYKKALRQIGYTEKEILEELISCNFDEDEGDI